MKHLSSDYEVFVDLHMVYKGKSFLMMLCVALSHWRNRHSQVMTIEFKRRD